MGIVKGIEEAAKSAKPIKHYNRAPASMFAEETLYDADKFKSTEKLIVMPIDDFLKLTPEGEDAAKKARVESIVQSGGKFEYPFLTIVNKGDVAKVDDHEGRHRARKLKEMGYTHMPVILKVSFGSGEGRSIRWSEQGNPANRDYLQVWPSTLEGQTGNKIPFPVPREKAPIQASKYYAKDENPVDLEEGLPVVRVKGETPQEPRPLPVVRVREEEKKNEVIPQAPTAKLLVVHGGRDFETASPDMLGKGEPGNIRPLGNGLYGYIVRNEEEAKDAIEWAKVYARKYGGANPQIHAFSIDVGIGDVSSNAKWARQFDKPKSPEEQARWDSFDAAAALSGPERLAAFEEHYKKYPRESYWEEKQRLAKIPYRTEELPIGIEEISVQDLSRLQRAGKWSINTSNEEIAKALLEQMQKEPAPE